MNKARFDESNEPRRFTLGIIVGRKPSRWLTRQEFDHDIGIDRQRNVGWTRSAQHGCSEPFGIESHPLKRSWRVVGDDPSVEVSHRFATSDLDHIARSQGERRTGYLDPVDFEVTVNDPLAGLRARLGQPKSADDVVQSSFAHEQ